MLYGPHCFRKKAPPTVLTVSLNFLSVYLWSSEVFPTFMSPRRTSFTSGFFIFDTSGMVLLRSRCSEDTFLSFFPYRLTVEPHDQDTLCKAETQLQFSYFNGQLLLFGIASLLAFNAKIQTPITIRRVNISIQLLGLQVAL
ncbi:hypothetical protein F7725_001981 [Dissostichus mawsoni]|uniref:Uncharacterized protein n=1 Tax=Dissostichus mawsoni TaxID=36200 RepID=A0A7J5Y144_DISMA|nr:hypothetical protein F7725_001981 [Dissostichus mawsoni]